MASVFHLAKNFVKFQNSPKILKISFPVYKIKKGKGLIFFNILRIMFMMKLLILCFQIDWFLKNFIKKKKFSIVFRKTIKN
jgi:hypothetical protein